MIEIHLVLVLECAVPIWFPILEPVSRIDGHVVSSDAKKFVELIKTAGNPNVEIVMYPGASHGFHADYRPAYKPEAAADAWKRCNAMLKKALS